MHIAHIVNFFATGDEEHKLAQTWVMESLRRARRYAQDDDVAVDLLSVQHPAQRIEVPQEFTCARDLDRTVLDLGTFEAPPLPLIGDIFDRLLEATVAPVVIYTNADIVVTPVFYSAVADVIRGGWKAFEIRRRTVARTPSTGPPRNLSLATASAEVGSSHPGSDCFVMHRSIAEQFLWRPICIGMPPVARSILMNMLAASEGVHSLVDVHLTFHIEDSRRWARDRYRAVTERNFAESRRLRNDLLEKYGSLPEQIDRMFGARRT